MNHEQKQQIVRSTLAYRKMEAHPDLDDVVLYEFEKEFIKGNRFGGRKFLPRDRGYSILMGCFR